MFVHFGRKLTIRHFVSRFQFCDSAAKLLALEALNELSLGLTWTHDQNCLRITNTSDHLDPSCTATVVERTGPFAWNNQWMHPVFISSA
jgi:hypothetical protein